MDRAPQLSVVTTMYRSAPYLRAFHERASRVASALFERVEFVYVNDGSPDESLAVALELARTDPRVRIVDLSRNFGHHHAIVAGLEHASGGLVYLIDCDLEEEPEMLDALVAAMRADGTADVAYGIATARKGGFVERVGGALAYIVINAVAGTFRLQPNMLVARVMSRRYVDAFVAQPESEIVFSGLSANVGFRQLGVPVRKLSRGTTTYTFARRLIMLVRTLTAFSDRPLIWIAYLGFTIVAASLAYALYLTVAYFVYRSIPAGYTSLAVSVWFLGGMILFCMGIIAIYLSVIFIEVKRRPRYVVREVYEPGAAVGASIPRRPV